MAATSIDTGHEDMIHDAQMDYYGRVLATSSSDKTVKLFLVDPAEGGAGGASRTLLHTLTGHDGPVWQVAWAHPQFGNILASCSYDGRVLIWKEAANVWTQLKDHRVHEASVNSIAWAPHEFGLALACASSDGKVSVVTCKADGQWDTQIFMAHGIGCNAVSWAPAIAAAVSSTTGSAPTAVKRLATGGCDNKVFIWRFVEEQNHWKQENELIDHQDWVRDVAWAPSASPNVSILASCSQDKQVIIWTKEGEDSEWTKTPLRKDKFPDAVWRLSWSVTGSILAVSSGDNKVSLWKESLEGFWEQVSELNKS